MQLLPHLWCYFCPNCGCSVSEHIEEEECKKRRKIQSKDRRDDPTEQIQVRVGDLEDGLKNTDSLSLWEPGKQDASSNHNVVDRQKVHESTNKDLLRHTISRDGHGRAVGRVRLAHSRKFSSSEIIVLIRFCDFGPSVGSSCLHVIRKENGR